MRRYLILLVLVALLGQPAPSLAAGDCTVSPADLSMDQEELSAVSLINAYRQQHSLGPLTQSPSLTRSASWMTHDMVTKHYLSHTDSLGRDSGGRMTDCGYDLYTWRGEDAGIGYATAAEIVAGWKGSAPHNALLLDPKYVGYGIARAQDVSNGAWTWTLDVGSSINNDPPFQAQVTTTPTQTSTPTVTPPPTPMRTATVTPSPTVPMTGGERLQNGGFESGLAGWERPAWYASTVDVAGGALRFQGRSSGPYVQQNVPTSAGSMVTVSGRVNVTARGNGMAGAVELLALNRYGGVIATYPVYSFASLTNGWISFSRSQSIPNGATTVSLRIRFPSLDGTVYLDDLSLR